jgi:hypothetical protein
MNCCGNIHVFLFPYHENGNAFLFPHSVKYQFFVKALVKYFVFEAVNNYLSFLAVTQIQEDECS